MRSMSRPLIVSPFVPLLEDGNEALAAVMGQGSGSGGFGGIALVRQRLEADADGNSVGLRGDVGRPMAAADDKAGESDARGEQQLMRVSPSSGLAEPLIKKLRPQAVLHRTTQPNRDQAAVHKPSKILPRSRAGLPARKADASITP